MVKQDRPRIAIIGAGNVAWHMSRALSAVADVVQIAATSLDSAQPLADELNRFNGNEICSAAEGLSGLFPDCDLYLIAVRDDAVAAVADNTPISPECGRTPRAVCRLMHWPVKVAVECFILSRLSLAVYRWIFAVCRC